MSTAPTRQQQEQYLQQVRLAAQEQMMQSLMTTMTEKCFKVQLKSERYSLLDAAKFMLRLLNTDLHRKERRPPGLLRVNLHFQLHR